MIPVHTHSHNQVYSTKSIRCTSCSGGLEPVSHPDVCSPAIVPCQHTVTPRMIVAGQPPANALPSHAPHFPYTKLEGFFHISDARAAVLKTENVCLHAKTTSRCGGHDATRDTVIRDALVVTPRSTRPLRHPISKLHFLHIPRRPRRRSRTSSSATYVYGGSVARVPQRLCARGASAAPKTGPRSSGHFPLSTTDVLLAHHPNHSHHQHSEPLALIGANRAPLRSVNARCAHEYYPQARMPRIAGIVWQVVRGLRMQCIPCCSAYRAAVHTELSNAGKAGCAFGRAPATHPMRPVSSCLVSQLSWSQGWRDDGLMCGAVWSVHGV